MVARVGLDHPEQLEHPVRRDRRVLLVLRASLEVLEDPAHKESSDKEVRCLAIYVIRLISTKQNKTRNGG